MDPSFSAFEMSLVARDLTWPAEAELPQNLQSKSREGKNSGCENRALVVRTVRIQFWWRGAESCLLMIGAVHGDRPRATIYLRLTVPFFKTSSNLAHNKRPYTLRTLVPTHPILVEARQKSRRAAFNALVDAHCCPQATALRAVRRDLQNGFHAAGFGFGFALVAPQASAMNGVFATRHRPSQKLMHGHRK
jgi:hypothetical protein